MVILVTGAQGFLGKNMVEALKQIKNERFPNIKIDKIYEYDKNSTLVDLDFYCSNCDFVINFAGVNRSEDSNEFINGNCVFLSTLISFLIKNNNKCPILLSSSIQATCIGRYNNDYGKSKKKAEEILFEYSKNYGIKSFVYRFPNVFGKWCKPNYNSVIATFCYNISHDLPIYISDENVQLDLLYIDDLIEEIICAIHGNGHKCDFDGIQPIFNGNGKYYSSPITYKLTLKEVVKWLYIFKNKKDSDILRFISENIFLQKLYETYLFYVNYSI